MTTEAQKKALRKYRQNNKNRFVTTSIRWRNAHRERYREYVECLKCGKIVRRWSMSAHKKSKYHVNHLKPEL